MTEVIAIYLAIFLLNIIEGSVVSIGAGAAIPYSQLEFFPVLVLIILADIVSDIFFYYIGNRSKGLLHTKVLKFIGLTQTRINKVRSFYNNHGRTTLIIAKFSDVFAVPAIFLAGSMDMNFVKFLRIVSFVSVIKSLMLVSAGYLLGSSIASSFRIVSDIILGVMLLILAILLTISGYNKINRAN